MDFFDIVKELRSEAPDVDKAARALKILGWICVAGAVWNFCFYFLAPLDEIPFHLPPGYPYLALMSLLFIGALFFYAAKAVKVMAPAGKRSGQLAIVLLIGICAGLFYFVVSNDDFPFFKDAFYLIPIVFLVIFSAQFGLPAYYGVRYLQRLPVKQSRFGEERFVPESITRTLDEKKGRSDTASKPKTEYKDALLPFGVFGTFALLIAVPLSLLFVAEKFWDVEKAGVLFMPAILLVLFGPVAYNYLPSKFEKQRRVVASYTGGGSIFMFNGSWPFFRLMVYDDGLEIRTTLHRFFIPYDQMDDFPEKIGFFSRGLLIRSNLPGVPSGIRYQGFGMKKIVQVVAERRNNFKKKIQGA